MQLYTKILLGMFIGVVSGLLLGPNSSLLPNDGVRLSSSALVVTSPGGSTGVSTAKGIRDAKVVEQKVDPNGGGDWLKIQWKLSPAQQLRLKTEGGASTSGAEGRLHTGWVQEQIPQVRRYATIGQGIVDYTEWIGRLFLALIKMVVVPLVFFSLVVGIASLGDVRKLGRMGGRTLAFFMLTTTVALVIGVSLANIVQPGSFLDENDRQILLSSYETAASSTVSSAAAAPSFSDQLISIVPTNPLAALASGNMLQIIFFAMMLGVALTFLKDGRAKLVVDVFDRLNEAMVMLVHIAMKLAPIGVGALLFKVVGNTGVSVLLALGVYGLVVLLGLLIHLTLTYGTVVRFGAGLGFLPFLGAIKEAMLVAFSTSSSSATLPVTMQCCEENLNVSSETTSFVLPLGATVNMDGTALYQGVAAIFIAQIYGMDLTLGDQATIVFSATMASVGAAGVPGAGMITLAMVLTAIGVPTEGLALILGVDRLLDMFRTATNVVGDSTATVFMAKLEGEKLRIMTDEEDAARTDKGFQGRLEHGQTAIHTDDGSGDFGQ